jgi:hypothetical protein
MKTPGKKRERPKLPPVSEEMKQWSALLRQELSTWPHVTSRPMFGLLGFYRGNTIFAALPVTRGLNSPNGLIFKFHRISPQLLRRAKSDPRVEVSRKAPGAGWYSFELRTEDDLRDALWWVNLAYETAKL